MMYPFARARAVLPCLLFMLAAATPAAAQQREAPIADTEDASLGSQAVGLGRLHVIAGLDVRNADFVRGSFDDDPVSLEQVPVHVQVGLVYELARDGDGDATRWLMLRTSNGFHAPTDDERTSPRSWYESNNLVGIAERLAPGLIGATTYAIKTSPNGIAGTSHEVSGVLSFARDRGLGALNPGFAATWRPKGGSGFYTQVSVEPGWSLGSSDDALRLSIPSVVGAGWAGFYERGSDNRVYGSTGLALQLPLAIGGGHWNARAEALVLVRDDRLRRLGGPSADTATAVPYVTIALAYAY